MNFGDNKPDHDRYEWTGILMADQECKRNGVENQITSHKLGYSTLEN